MNKKYIRGVIPGAGPYFWDGSNWVRRLEKAKLYAPDDSTIWGKVEYLEKRHPLYDIYVCEKAVKEESHVCAPV